MAGRKWLTASGQVGKEAGVELAGQMLITKKRAGSDVANVECLYVPIGFICGFALHRAENLLFQLQVHTLPSNAAEARRCLCSIHGRHRELALQRCCV